MLKNLFNSNKNSLLGVDVGQNSVKLIELKKRKKQLELVAYANVAFDAKVSRSNESKIISKAIKTAIFQSKTKVRNAAIALSHSAIISKTVSLNCKLTAAEIEKFVSLNAEKQIGYSLDKVGIDYCVAENIDEYGAANKSTLQIVAVRKERIDKCIALLNEAGLEAKIIDIDSFALERATRMQVIDEDKIIAAINLDFGSILLCVLDNKKLLYANEVFIDDNELQSAAQIVVQIKKIVQMCMLSQHMQIRQIYLSGEKANNNILLATVTEELKIPTCLANPFEFIKIYNVTDEIKLKQIGSSMLISCGLALRKFSHDFN